jgi:hypothetical protein
MAEEEQRVIEEAPNTSTGIEECDVAKYFELRQDLNEFADYYQREVMRQLAA